MNLLLHVGLHRCATTAFQSYLAAHAAELAANRIRVGAGAVGAPALHRTLAQIPAGADWLVVSEENLLGPMIGIGTRLMAGLPAAGEAVRDAMAGGRVAVLLAFREPKAFLSSVYRFRLSVGETRDPEAFVRDIEPDGLSVMPLVTRLERIYGAGAVRLLDFDDVRRTRGLAYVRAGEAVTGRAWPGADALPLVNDTYPEVVAALMAALPDLGLALGKRHVHEICAIAHAFRHDYNRSPDTWRQITEEMATVASAGVVPVPHWVRGQIRFQLAERLARTAGFRTLAPGRRARVGDLVRQAVASGETPVADALWAALSPQHRARLEAEHAMLVDLARTGAAEARAGTEAGVSGD
ncbi:hypothetical protein [Propylenella binzhouense]|uniref:Uncharacterized protein n=1 Tax=Propylenella binzhouense TaxID=2555902 RepID=A0A964T6J4_9HYPH|nr:hypothetical protein [Propylenella binzhouense]MYZ48327.1 hypothetical protein [Propylenella binzhouense]